MAVPRFGVCLAAAATFLASAAAASPPSAPRRAPLLLQRRRDGAGGAAAAEAQTSGHRSQAVASASSAATSEVAHGQGAAGKAALPQDASFFNSFSEGESTYDVDGDVGITTDGDGWEPTLSSPYEIKGTDSAWFHESPSGNIAWQTHYPALQTGLAGRAATLGKWVQSAAGSWEQEYVPTGSTRTIQSGKLKLPAKWFDNSINQLDGFGRPKFPDDANPKRFVDWDEQAVNTTMKCDSPGCVATAALQAFDGKKLMARNCRLNIFVQHYSGHTVEWMSVNGANVSSKCKVPANNCNATGARPLYPCVFELSLDKLISQTGTLDISAKISDSAAANCTYENSLLLAVPMATCLVHSLAWPPTNLTNFPAPNTSLASVGVKLRRPVAAHRTK